MKKPFLLFEMLTALGLVAIMLSLLFSFLVQSVKTEKKIETIRATVLERQHLQIRLSDLFTTSPSLYTEKGNLHILFDNGIDPNPRFSGMLQGLISLEKDNLYLTYAPDGNNPPKRKELLSTHVGSASFQFFGPTWEPTWPKDKGAIPSMIRLTLTQNGHKIPFVFRLPNSCPIATYEAS